MGWPCSPVRRGCRFPLLGRLSHRYEPAWLPTHLLAAPMQDRARDSFENLLFGLCRFYELTGRYPDFIVVVRLVFPVFPYGTAVPWSRCALAHPVQQQPCWPCPA